MSYDVIHLLTLSAPSNLVEDGESLVQASKKVETTSDLKIMMFYVSVLVSVTFADLDPVTYIAASWLHDGHLILYS